MLLVIIFAAVSGVAVVAGVAHQTREVIKQEGIVMRMRSDAVCIGRRAYCARLPQTAAQKEK